MRQDLKKIRLSVLSLCTLAGIMFVGLKGCKHESLPSQTLRDVPARMAMESLRALRDTSNGERNSPHKPYVPPEATVTITPKDPTKTLQEVVDIRTKTYGLCFKPGIQATLPLGVGLDAKLGFYGRYGFGVAVLASGGTREDQSGIRSIDAAVFGSRHFTVVDNLEATAGYKFREKLPYVGLRLSF